MEWHDIQRLEHIADYCRDIESAVLRFGSDYDIFFSDKDYHDVVTFRIFQIGELTGKLSEELRAKTSDRINWQQIKAMRNIIAHNYGSVKLEIVWSVVTEDIPKLKAFCEELLSSD